MSELLVVAVFGIGAAVCIIGGVGIGAAITLWTIDRILALTKTTWIVTWWWFSTHVQKRPKG